MAGSVILEQDTSNCARPHPEIGLTGTNVFPETTVAQRRIIITNERIENEKKLNKSHWLGFVAKLNPFYWFSKKGRGPDAPVSVGGCNATL